jgi:hypothetical protein
MSSLGILMLDTRFARPAGDVGNRNTWPFPVCFERVSGAVADKVVREPGMPRFDAFLAAAQRLVGQGAIGISSSCGFLVRYQQALADALPVPVAISSLLQVPWVEQTLPRGRRVGVITFDAASLGAAELQQAGAPPDTPCQGLPPRGALHDLVLRNCEPIDRQAIGRELLACGQALCKRHPEVAAMVLECTNLPPYRDALCEALGMPVFDTVSLAHWFWNGLNPKRSNPTYFYSTDSL